jgi:tripartite-type tricarboxylate transporter receptor subunit TctC
VAAVLVDGKADAGGTIGVATAAKATPDDYTLGVTPSSTQVLIPSYGR